jgi:asparagine synthase (glutamine-hydrolysing)
MAARVAGLTSEPNCDVYEGLSRLPAGHALVFDRQGLRLRRHWSLDPGAPTIKLASDEAYAAAGRALLDGAVSMAVRTGKGVGADLTGGLDSSAVAVSALRRIGGEKRLPVFTHVPEEGWDGRVQAGRYGDETPYVREIIAMHPRLEPNCLTSADRSWDHGLRDLISSGEVVPGLPRWLSVWEQTFRSAQSQGLSVVLNGGGGNMGLSWEGRGAFLAWFRSGRWHTLCRELAAVSDGPKAFARALASRVIVPAGPVWLWRLYVRFKHGSTQLAWTRVSFANPDLASTLKLASRAGELGAEYMRFTDYRAIRARFLMADDPEGAELCRAARVTYGVDYRSPLQDPRLLEWCLAVPEEQYWRNGQHRWLMRRIMADRLPKSVVANRRRGAPGADWHFQMTRQLPLMREQVEVLSADPDVAALIDFPRIRKTLDHWPDRTPVDAGDPLSFLLPVALPHALAVGQFIRWTKGANL